MRFVLIGRTAFLASCVLAGLAPLRLPSHAIASMALPDWPTQWDGREILQVPLSAREERFSENFPGRIAKFTDGTREFIFRRVTTATRQLHSSADCFRGAGYTITPQPAFRDQSERQWSVFLARRDGRQLLVRERISDQRGREWTDVSGWFWAVTLGRTEGPWLSVTAVEAHDQP